MFVDADVLSILKGAEIRHFLDLRDASYREQTSRRLRLNHKKYEQVSHAGGMLLRSAKELEALRGIGLIELTINTDKSDVVPDVQELRDERAQDESDVGIDSLDESVAVSTAADVPETASRIRGAEVGSSDRRRNFGPGRAGWMKVELNRETREAILQVISFGGDASLTSDDIIACLKSEYCIASTFDEEMIGRLAKQAGAASSRVIRGQFTVAHDVELDHSALGEIEYTCLDDVPPGTALLYGAMQEALSRPTLREVLANPPPVRVVMPGEELAVFVADAEEELECPDPETLLRAAENVHVLQGRYMSQIHGYVCIIADEISVVPPIWVSPDAMEAHYVRFPHVGPEPMLTAEWFQQLLELTDVQFGLQESEIDRLLQDSDTPGAFRIARGKPSEPGTDATLHLLYEKAAERAASTSEGKTTAQVVAARYEAAEVKAGDMLAELTLAEDAVPGCDVRGRESSPSPATDITLLAGNNVRGEERGRRRYFYAELSGRVHMKKQVMSVRTVTYIDRDVESPLQIEEGKDVHIRGSVRAGTVLTSRGSIVIDGVVEGGARVEAADDITIGKGIIGRNTRVVAQGNLEVTFAQNASLAARGDITIADYLVNGTVRAGGVLLMTGEAEGERSGSVVGGEIIASGGIAARRIQSGPNPGTVAIAPDPDLAARLAKADQAVDFCRKNMLRIFRTLGITAIDATQFKQLIEASPPHRRKPVMQLLGQLKGLVQKRSLSLNRKKELQSECERMYEKVEIRVAEGIDEDVQVRIGDVELILPEDLSGVALRRKGERILTEEV